MCIDQQQNSYIQISFWNTPIVLINGAIKIKSQSIKILTTWYLFVIINLSWFICIYFVLGITNILNLKPGCDISKPYNMTWDED